MKPEEKVIHELYNNPAFKDFSSEEVLEIVSKLRGPVKHEKFEEGEDLPDVKSNNIWLALGMPESVPDDFRKFMDDLVEESEDIRQFSDVIRKAYKKINKQHICMMIFILYTHHMKAKSEEKMREKAIQELTKGGPLGAIIKALKKGLDDGEGTQGFGFTLGPDGEIRPI